MERRPHGAPASSPACAAPSGRFNSSPQPRRPLPHRRSRNNLLQNWRALTHGAPAPWSAGVLAGLRRTAGSVQLLPAATPPAAAPAVRKQPTPELARPDPWSAGVLAGLRRTVGSVQLFTAATPPERRYPPGAVWHDGFRSRRRAAPAALLAFTALAASGCSASPQSPPPQDATARIAAAIAATPADAFTGLGRSIWIGAANAGEALYRESDDLPRPAASSIKTAYLVEFFADRAGALDEPVPDAAAVVGDPQHAAIVHFDAEVQTEIREHLEPATARTVGRHMIRGTDVSNAVYNAAANLVTAHLGGPPDLTRRIHERHPDLAGITARRYMLAARDVTGDNEVTAGSLATVLGGIARGDLPGIAPETHEALRDVLFLEESPEGRHYYKGGSLNSSPITRVLSGYFERPGDAPGQQLVYAFMAELPGPDGIGLGNLDSGEAGRQLQDYLEALREATLPIAREALAQ